MQECGFAPHRRIRSYRWGRVPGGRKAVGGRPGNAGRLVSSPECYSANRALPSTLLSGDQPRCALAVPGGQARVAILTPREMHEGRRGQDVELCASCEEEPVTANARATQFAVCGQRTCAAAAACPKGRWGALPPRLLSSTSTNPLSAAAEAAHCGRHCVDHPRDFGIGEALVAR